MTSTTAGPMWLEFKAFWPGIRRAGSSVLVGGGFGLILKQIWLGMNTGIRTVVPLAHWLDSTPRVTKDCDIVVGLDLIGSREAQSQVARVLAMCGFEATEQNPRWQFQKVLGGRGGMCVEFHSRLPKPDETGHIKTDRIRVKHHPSLGGQGIHARQNPEAAGCDLHPFSFELEGIGISVPNPVTWCNMKLTAMRDRWEMAQEGGDTDYRDLQRAQANKHAQDVCRIVAMTSAAERDHAAAIIAAISAEPAYQQAAEICERLFLGEEATGLAPVRRMWQGEDPATIRSVLREWYRLR